MADAATVACKKSRLDIIQISFIFIIMNVYKKINPTTVNCCGVNYLI